MLYKLKFILILKLTTNNLINLKVIGTYGVIVDILDVTEDHIFKTLGRGRDPKYKPKSKAQLKETIEPFDFSRLLE